MAVELNHTIVWSRDKHEASAFLTDLLGLAEARPFLHFLVVDLANGVSLDYADHEGDIAIQHYAFLVTDAEFDAIHGRIVGAGLDHWADPGRSTPGVNDYFGGRGTYVADPSGHLLEFITRPYGDDPRLTG